MPISYDPIATKASLDALRATKPVTILAAVRCLQALTLHCVGPKRLAALDLYLGQRAEPFTLALISDTAVSVANELDDDDAAPLVELALALDALPPMPSGGPATTRADVAPLTLPRLTDPYPWEEAPAQAATGRPHPCLTPQLYAVPRADAHLGATDQPRAGIAGDDGEHEHQEALVATWDSHTGLVAMGAA